MGKIQELYDTRVRQMAPTERLQLARLILDDLAPTEGSIDVRDEWGAEDFVEVCAFSARHADQPKNAGTKSNESR